MSTPLTEGGLTQVRPGSGPRTAVSNLPRTILSNLQPATSPDANPLEATPTDTLGSLLIDNAPEAHELGLYVHVPFCAKRCGYCSFNTAPFEDGVMGRYLEAVQRELELLGALPWASRIRLGTIFFGGGTPSLMEAEELTAVLDRIRARFDVVADAEVTVECNPESVTRAKLEGYRAAGVNRLSLGVQSLDARTPPRARPPPHARGLPRRRLESAEPRRAVPRRRDPPAARPAPRRAGCARRVRGGAGGRLRQTAPRPPGRAARARTPPEAHRRT